MKNSSKLYNAIEKKVLILDGAMGSLIQTYKLNEKVFRGERFKDWHINLKGNYDILSITQPDIIKDVHKQYLEAGADIITTNTFNANLISMEDYDMHNFDLVYEMNLKSVQIARSICDEFSEKNKDKFRFVAGSVGPTNRTLSILGNDKNSTKRAVNFNYFVEAYTPQIKALLDGGADIILIETVVDTLVAKAALYVVQREAKERNIVIPIMLSGVFIDKVGITLSGKTIEDFISYFSNVELLTIGLNCSSAKSIFAQIEKIAKKSNFKISAYPNAGMPNKFGEYEETPQKMTIQIKQFLDNSYVNIVGGCCGTTPEHICEVAKLVENKACL